jgi:hypothetical protein
VYLSQQQHLLATSTDGCSGSGWSRQQAGVLQQPAHGPLDNCSADVSVVHVATTLSARALSCLSLSGGHGRLAREAVGHSAASLAVSR